MAFSRNWIGNIVSQGERYVVQYLDRKFGGRIRRVFEVTPEGVEVVGDLDVSEGRITGDGSLSAEDLNKLATVPAGGLIRTAFLSDEIDMAVVADYAFGGNWVSMPGFKLVNMTAVLIFTNLAATTFLTTGSISFGNDGAFTNMVATVAAPTATQLNSFLATGNGGPYFGITLVASTNPAKTPDLAVVPTFRVATAVTGTAVTQAKARLYVTGTVTNLLPTI